MPKKTDAVIAKTEQNKELLIDQIRKTPIIQVACEKTGIGRATYYRWRKEDETFRDRSDEALMEGIHLINDMAESQLISAIKDKHMTAIIFWLKNRHKDYKTRVEVSTATTGFSMCTFINILSTSQLLFIEKLLNLLKTRT